MTTQDSGRERRQYQRYELRIAAEISYGDRQFTAVTRDMSAGGCCITAAYPLTELTTVQLNLFVVVDDVEEATMPALEVRAIVQWAAENDDAPTEQRHVAGLRFEGITDAQQQWLQGVLERIQVG